MQSSARIAYLISRYPAVSHTFVLREILALRGLGYEVLPASINLPDQQQLAGVELEEAERTYYLKQHGWRGALVAHVWGCLRPWAYLRAVYFAVCLAGLDLARVLKNFCYFTEALMLARWMQAQNLSHLHVHFATAASSVALILKRFVPISLSLTVHGPDEFYDAERLYLAKKIAAADFVVCISQYARSQLMLLSSAQDWHKFIVCPLGVDIPRDLFIARRESEEFTVLCVGRLAAAKGQRVLLLACQQLVQQGRRLRLILAGAGPELLGLQAEVIRLNLAGCVEFTGALNPTQVQVLYQRCDVFALASFAEGVPVVLMEAMASGVPCVSTRITGIPELIEHGVSGLLVSPSSVTELAEALARLQDDPFLCQRLAEQGRQKVIQDYHLINNVRRLAQVFLHRIPQSEVQAKLPWVVAK